MFDYLISHADKFSTLFSVIMCSSRYSKTQEHSSLYRTCTIHFNSSQHDLEHYDFSTVPLNVRWWSFVVFLSSNGNSQNHNVSKTEEVLMKFVKQLLYLGFYVAFKTVQVISRLVVERAEETSTYSWSRFCTLNCRPMASNYQLSHLRQSREPNPGLRGGRRECYHSATVAPCKVVTHTTKQNMYMTGSV